jgi:hypothetical protein
MRLIALLVTACLLGACSSAPKRPTPVTQIDEKVCAEAIQFERATVINPKRNDVQSYRVDRRSPCLRTDAGPMSYLAFRLLEFESPYSVTVESEQVGGVLFAPQLGLMDEAGHVSRRLAFEDFSLRGTLLRATVFVNAENAQERYLIVTSAVGQVGQTRQPIVAQVTMIPVLTGLLPMMWVSGSEYQGQYTLAHNGQIRMQAQFAPGAVPAKSQAQKRDGQPHEIPAKLMAARQ